MLKCQPSSCLDPVWKEDGNIKSSWEYIEALRHFVVLGEKHGFGSEEGSCSSLLLCGGLLYTM